MAWRRPGDKPLFEPMLVNLVTHICVTRPQWVNSSVIKWPHLSTDWCECVNKALCIQKIFLLACATVKILHLSMQILYDVYSIISFRFGGMLQWWWEFPWHHFRLPSWICDDVTSGHHLGFMVTLLLVTILWYPRWWPEVTSPQTQDGGLKVMSPQIQDGDQKWRHRNSHHYHHSIPPNLEHKLMFTRQVYKNPLAWLAILLALDHQQMGCVQVWSIYLPKSKQDNKILWWINHSFFLFGIKLNI